MFVIKELNAHAYTLTFLFKACPYFDKTDSDSGSKDDRIGKPDTVKIPRESDFLTHFSQHIGNSF